MRHYTQCGLYLEHDLTLLQNVKRVLFQEFFFTNSQNNKELSGFPGYERGVIQTKIISKMLSSTLGKTCRDRIVCLLPRPNPFSHLIKEFGSRYTNGIGVQTNSSQNLTKNEEFSEKISDSNSQQIKITITS